MVIDAVMHDAKVDAVEIDDLVFLVIHFGRSVEEFGACGAQVRAPAGSRVIPVARGRWPRMKILRLGERLADEARSDNFSIDTHETAVGVLRKNQLGHAGHHRGVQQSGEDRKNQRQTKSRSKFLNHVLLLFWRAPNSARTPLRQMQTNDDLVNQPNAGKWHDDSTEAVDQKVSAQHLASAHGLIPPTPKS